MDPRITLLLQLLGQDPTTILPLIERGIAAVAGVRGATSDEGRIEGVTDVLTVIAGLRTAIGGADEPLNSDEIALVKAEIEADTVIANKVFDNTKKSVS